MNFLKKDKRREKGEREDEEKFKKEVKYRYSGQKMKQKKTILSRILWESFFLRAWEGFQVLWNSWQQTRNLHYCYSYTFFIIHTLVNEIVHSYIFLQIKVFKNEEKYRRIA